MDCVILAVNGSLMKGFDLNVNLIAVNARFVREAFTISEYRLWSIHGQYPAMQRYALKGSAIALEIWSLTPQALLTVLQQEPAGLVLGKIILEDNSMVLGILGEAWICEGQPEITAYGGWRNYLKNGKPYEPTVF